MLTNFEQQLLSKYKALHAQDGLPCWAYEFSPPIPLVGNRLKHKSKRVLVYGSAENLAYSVKPQAEINYLGEELWYRHRRYLSAKGNQHPFPDVHMQPINDGSLLTVARYIVAHLGLDGEFSNDPFEFIEEVAVANFCKFAIDPVKIGQKKGKNVDYAQDFSKLKENLNYVKSDLEILQPDIIVLPKTIFNTINKHVLWQSIKAELEIEHELRFVKIYQTNVRVIHTHITKQLSGEQVRHFEYAFVDNWLNKPSIRGLEKYLCWLHLKFDELQERL